MNEVEIYAELTSVFHEAFDDDTITISPKTTAEDIKGWDSVKMVAIIIATESKFKIKMRSRDVDRLQNVGDLVEIIKAYKKQP